jgi:hypothetical protein
VSRLVDILRFYYLIIIRVSLRSFSRLGEVTQLTIEYFPTPNLTEDSQQTREESESTTIIQNSLTVLGERVPLCHAERCPAYLVQQEEHAEKLLRLGMLRSIMEIWR